MGVVVVVPRMASKLLLLAGWSLHCIIIIIMVVMERGRRQEIEWQLRVGADWEGIIASWQQGRRRRRQLTSTKGCCCQIPGFGGGAEQHSNSIHVAHK